MLHIVYSELPPSSNHIYSRSKFGVHLTKQAKKYAEDFSKYAVTHHLHELSTVNVHGVFAVHLRFYFPSLINEGVYNKNPKNRPTTLYKRIDLSNRIKLLEDCVRDLLAVDDSQTFAASQEKIHDPSSGELGRVEITVQEVDPVHFGLPSAEEINALVLGLKKKG